MSSKYHLFVYVFFFLCFVLFGFLLLRKVETLVPLERFVLLFVFVVVHVKVLPVSHKSYPGDRISTKRVTNMMKGISPP